MGTFFLVGNAFRPDSCHDLAMHPLCRLLSGRERGWLSFLGCLLSGLIYSLFSHTN